MKPFISIIIISTIIIGCGGNKDGAVANPLSDEQKAQLKELVIASGRPIVAGGYAAKQSREIFNPASDEVTLKMAGQLKSSVNYGQCAHTWVDKTGSGGSISFGTNQIEFGLNGTYCPVDLLVKVENKTVPGKIGQFWNIAYKAKNSELIAMNDVTEFSMGGLVDINYSNSEINGAGKVDGNILSKKYGSVGLTITHEIRGNSESVDMNQTTRFAFKDFTAEIRVERKMSNSGNSVTYSLNGQTVSKDELRDLLSGNTLLDVVTSSN